MTLQMLVYCVVVWLSHNAGISRQSLTVRSVRGWRLWRSVF